MVKNNQKDIIHIHQPSPDIPEIPFNSSTGNPLAFLERIYNKIPPPATAPPVNPVKQTP